MSRAKSKLIDVLETVSFETDLPVAKIMSRCSDLETVDARWICVRLLKGEGYYPGRIAELMGITPRYVQYILTDFDDRIAQNRVMRNNYERSAKRMRKGGEPTA